MADKIKITLLIFFMTTLAVSCCSGQNMEVMCSGEMEFEQLRKPWSHKNEEEFLHAFVLPDSGLYKRYLTYSKGEVLDPNEHAALKIIEKPFRNPVFAIPLFIVLDQAKQKNAQRHVTALCILSQEALDSPFLNPYLNGSVEPVDFGLFSQFSKLKHLELYATRPLKDSFAGIAKLTKLEYLGLHVKCNDTDMKHISGLSRLSFVNAGGTAITGPGLKYLAKLGNLKTLNLRATKLQDGALEHLKLCRNLETILLSDTQTDDEDLKLLAGIKTLKYLTLHRTKVTDAGLASLAKLKGLEYVSLYDTKTSKTGYDHLRESNSDIILKLKRPQYLKEFMTDRFFVHACTGDYNAQYRLVKEYKYSRKKLKDSKDRGALDTLLININSRDYYRSMAVFDSIDYMAWFLVCKAQKDKHPNSKYTDYFQKEIAELEKQLSRIELIEAKRRARVYSYLSDKVSHEFKIERHPGLPVYQYGFDFISLDKEPSN